MRTVAVSGAFDPLHVGHIELFKEAAKLGKVTCILKGDNRLIRKKGAYLMPAVERAEIIASIKYISDVFIYDSLEGDPDDFSPALEKIRPDVYCAGADKKDSGDLPLIADVCRTCGIEIVCGVGGEKISSSSEILGKYIWKVTKD